MIFTFFFPPLVDPLVAPGLKTKRSSREKPPMPDSELFNGVESTNNSQAVYRTLVVGLVAGTMRDHRRNGRQSISSLRRREFRVRVRRKLTLQSVASVQRLHLNAGEKAQIADSSLRNAVSLSPARTTKSFALSPCTSAIEIFRPLEGIAET
jgi:hypothetical protein